MVLSAGGRGICAFPGLKQRVEPKVKCPEGIQARVHGPHPGERLRHVVHGILYHRSRVTRLVAGRNVSGAILLGKDEEQNWDGVSERISCNSVRTPAAVQKRSHTRQVEEAESHQ
jgi:hypothetical protein